jgi:predicted membrane-bound spermidine synthase
MEGMTTTLLDRVVRWNLDFDGDIYGDERERLRWYEGIATAASLQWMAIPWAAAVMVWPLGRPSVVPLAVVLAVLVLPMWLSAVYVRSRRVDTVPRRWTGKRLLLSILGGLPFLVFLIGALYVTDPESSSWRGAIVGAAIGGAIGIVMSAMKVRRRRRAEAAIVGDED